MTLQQGGCHRGRYVLCYVIENRRGVDAGFGVCGASHVRAVAGVLFARVRVCVIYEQAVVGDTLCGQPTKPQEQFHSRGSSPLIQFLSNC